MKINQAAELAGITSKNIRFYEDRGLITPARDAGNGYRDYSMEDVEQLYRIKLHTGFGSDAFFKRIRSCTEGSDCVLSHCGRSNSCRGSLCA
ncbi:MAG: MerR family transcriptional regulator [Clostridiales bacterium]|nr:MerR family transcriptional regulator [Clostridiales bacterium]